MLTLSQQKTLDFIKKFLRIKGYAPTASEIANGIGITSRGVVHRYLKALQEAGELHLLPNRHRNIQLVNRVSPKVLPLVGCIAAGQPIEAIAEHESINITEIFLGENRFALRVKGDSMIDEGIFDGDIVVCEHASTARDGQIVVALIDQEHATLKRLKRENNELITLLPANRALKPMLYESSRVTIQGIYIGLIRF